MAVSPASSSASSRSSPIHHASLVDPARHSPALLELIELKMSRPIIEYVVDCVVDTVDFAMGRPSSTHGRPVSRRPEHAKFTNFVSNIITRAEVSTPTVLASLVYIDRAKPHLHIALEEWALERVFLGALIVASKYLNDSTLKNVHWALCTGVFGKRDVGRIEREFLDVLDFELNVAEDDILSHHDNLSAVAVLSYPHQTSRSFIHPHAHRRAHHHAQPVPELEPSSDDSASSPGSASPRTPSTAATSPSYPPSRKGPQPQHAKSEPFPPTNMELLRSFPIIPLPAPAHHSHTHGRLPSQDHAPHAQRPIRLSA
ncbi:putative cyclin [Lyophyllum shimeji]|uniref:Cyclin n=1 Tax=Lyophyllum shimeji TaxID=47721 RepID=A0A9P3PFN6_LYOSH|nr:putative cyclin [Lyophyllum shimeji]